MPTRPSFAVPARPESLHTVGLPFWGERRPPENFADVFRAYAAEETTGSGSDVTTRTVATLRIYGPIYDGWYGVSARSVSEALDELGEVDEIRVRINSPGGDAWEGMTIMNMLRAHQAQVVAVVDGVAASAASFIAAGCDETVMSPGTQMMIHDASAFAYGPAETMRKAATFLDSVSNAVASIYTDVAGGTDAGWRELMVETTWYTAAEAVEAGLADRVGVVPDAGPADTAPVPELPDLEDSEVEDSWDFSMYPYAGRSKAPAPKPPTASADGSITTQEGSTAVAFSDEQLATMRQELGLPEDADEATIVAALSEALEERAETPASNTATPPEGMVLVESDVLDQLRTGAEQGTAARTQQLIEKRDRAINQAIADGKITPARKDHWVAQWDADPEGAEQTLNALAAGLVPVEERGHDQDTAAGGVYDELYGHESQKGA